MIVMIPVIKGCSEVFGYTIEVNPCDRILNHAETFLREKSHIRRKQKWCKSLRTEETLAMNVRLSRAELSTAKQACNLRMQLATASGIKDRKRNAKRSDAEIVHLSIKAEIAVAKIFAIQSNAHILGVDDGADLWFDDVSIDVKSTFRADGNLNIMTNENLERKDFKSSVVVFVTPTVEDDVLRVVGWTHQKHFFNSAKIVDYGYGKNFALEQDKLLEIGKLWTLLIERRARAHNQ